MKNLYILMKVVLNLTFAKIEDGARKVKNLTERKAVNILREQILQLAMLIKKAYPLWYLMVHVRQNYSKLGLNLIKELVPGQFVVMDNASFHKSQKTIELIETVGCKIIFLPPYSPDLNPIEKFWANMKRWFKDKITLFANLYDTLTHFFSAPNSM